MIARLRLPQAGEEEARAGKEAAARTERMKQRTPRVDLRRVAEGMSSPCPAPLKGQA